MKIKTAGAIKFILLFSSFYPHALFAEHPIEIFFAMSPAELAMIPIDTATAPTATSPTLYGLDPGTKKTQEIKGTSQNTLSQFSPTRVEWGYNRQPAISADPAKPKPSF